MQSLLWLSLVPLTLLVGAPPSADGRVGVVWHDQATVAPELRQRVTDVLVSQLGVPRDAIVQDADLRARVAIAHRFSSDLARDASLLESALTGAAASYRAGEIEAATVALDRVEARLRDDPGIAAASILMGRAAVLRAQIAWTQGDDAAMNDALEVAVALDPEARLSTRHVQPAIALAHEQVRARVLATRDTWVAFGVRGADEGAVVDVDDRPAPGEVPPGRHFVTVRRPGHPPRSMYLAAGETIELSPEPAIVDPGLPHDRAEAEAICEAVELDRILLARERGGRVAVQPYACGEGFGVTEFSDDLELDGLVVASAEAGGNAKAAGRLHDDAPWPVPRGHDVDPGPTTPRDPPPPPPKAWYRRAWVWVLIGGVVAGGVTTGAVLGTRASSGGIEVDAPSFQPP